MIISINGKITDEKKANIPVTSNAFLFGYAVFETIRTYKRKVFRLNDHLGRLYVSADIIGVNPKWTLDKTHKEIAKALAKSKWKEAKIRIILTDDDLIIMIEQLKEKKPSMYKKGVGLVSFHGKRNVPHAKKLASAFCYLAKQHALKCGAYESLLVDPTSYVRECAYANIFWVKNGILYSTNKEILFGITRETVIELAGDCNFKGILYKSLIDVDEVFITQTTSGILPVIEIDGHKIGKGKPGPVTKSLMKKFSKLVWEK